jgi:radical SAM family uncharacterized protein/radical SAM-linked protein
MLHLGGIPLRAEERNSSDSWPLVIAGGPCAVNPMPMSPFIDAFLIGDGEEAIKEILDAYYQWKIGGDGKRSSFLRFLSGIEGVYVPSVHDTSAFSLHPAPVIRRRIIGSLQDAAYPDKPVVPYTSIVHDRINIEISRGCPMGCRFCQAGMIYRPVRERSPEKVLELAEKSLRSTGYEEVSFTSLSAGDYSCLLPLVGAFNKRFEREKIALSLPSLRVKSINNDLLKEIRTVRKTGFTIAPEAGTERLRRVINKDFTQEDYEQALSTLFEAGWLNLKLYFMIGLPTETEGDIEAIPRMALEALKTARKFAKRHVNINIGVSPFVPKAHTPFQWYGQNPSDELKRKKMYIKEKLMKRGCNVKWHDVRMSLLEAAFSRGDRSLAPLLEKAWSLGCRLDGWTELFDFEAWKTAMDLTGIDAAGFATRSFQASDTLPWDRIDIGVTKAFLRKEYEKALAGEASTDCRKVCHSCGLDCHERTDKTAGTEDVKTGEMPEMASRLPDFPTSPPRRFRPVTIRVEFSKTGRLRYLSHLELVTALHRALRRAEVPLEYSQGFHPSPKIAFGPPLSVGVAGLAEYFDMEIAPPFDLVVNKDRLNSLLPTGISVKDMSAVHAKGRSLNSFIMRYEYEIKGGDPSRVRVFLAEKEITIRREKGTVNIRRMVEDARQTDDERTTVLLVDQGEIKVRLGELLPVILDAPMEELDITRTALYGWNGGWVKPIERSLQWTAKY